MLIEELATALRTNPEHWRPLVLTNGCFDLLHAGHIDYLKKARALGRTLVVGLNSDISVRRLKGPTRPINSEQARACVLGAVRWVDAIVIFAEPTASTLVEILKPDIYVKGGDYTLDSLPETEAVHTAGGRVELIPFTWQLSTTALIARSQS